MDAREKLVELLERAFESFIDDPFCIPDERKFADHLIANGITFATGNNFAPQLMPMGAITYAVACSHCKNRGADAKKCDQCRCEVKSWFEFDPATVQQWISVKDRLPENNTRVVVCYNNPIDGEKTVSSDVFWKGHWVRFGETVTHWMPLPPAPEENK